MKKIVIGITGNIGSGKTKIANLFREFNFEIIELDKLAHNFYKEKKFKKKVIKIFGDKILGNNNEIDRNKLRRLVFSSENNLNKLNKLVHPKLKEELKLKLKKLKKEKNNGIIIDAALIYELKIENLCNYVIVVATNRFFSFLRLFFSRGLSYKEFNSIYNSQMSIKEKMKRADFVIRNNLIWFLNKSIVKSKINKIIKKLNYR
jgi:dephospho-CoA kinase